MAKIRSKFGEQQLVMVNYACGLNQSERGKYFEWIIIHIIQLKNLKIVEKPMTANTQLQVLNDDWVHNTVLKHEIDTTMNKEK